LPTKTRSIKSIEDTFSKTEVREWKKQMEPIRPVHKPWVEIDENNNVTWEPDEDDTYTSTTCGPNTGPSSAMMEVVRTTTLLESVCLFIVPEKFFTQVAKWTKKFYYQDWDVERYGTDRDRGTKKRRHFVEVPAFEGSVLYPGRRHRADKERKKYNITAGFVMCWVWLRSFGTSNRMAHQYHTSKMQ